MKLISDDWALRIVAWLFLLSGLSTARDFVVAVWEHRVIIPYGMLGILVFFGLLERRNGWRVVALAFLGIGLCSAPIVLLMILGGHASNLFVDLIVYRFEGVSWHVLVASMAAIWLLNLWEVSVLLRPTVRVAFRQASDATPRLSRMAGTAVAAVLLAGIGWYLVAIPYHNMRSDVSGSLSYATASAEDGAKFQAALKAYLTEKGFQPATPERDPLMAAVMPGGNKLSDNTVAVFSVRGTYDHSKPFYFRYGLTDMPRGLAFQAFTEWSVTGTKAEIEHQAEAVEKFTADLKEFAAKYNRLLEQQKASAQVAK